MEAEISRNIALSVKMECIATHTASIMEDKPFKRRRLIMNEVVNDFKVELEKMMDDWYNSLEHLVDGAMFNMSFYGTDVDKQFSMLQDVMIEVLQERIGCLLEESGESQ